MRRIGTLSLLALLGACATRPIWEPTAPSDLEITLRRDLDDRESEVFVLRIVNRSQNPVCLSAGVVRNRYSTELWTRYRDARGRDRTNYAQGFIPPPLPGSVRIEPGSGVEGRHSLVGFRGVRESQPFPREWEAQVGFEYGYCSDHYSGCDPRWSGPDCLDRYSQRARSSWQRL